MPVTNSILVILQVISVHSFLNKLKIQLGYPVLFSVHFLIFHIFQIMVPKIEQMERTHLIIAI